MNSGWHHAFNPQSFLKRIKIEDLLSKNDAYAENKIDKLGKPCLSCSGYTAPGLLLNDGSYLCKHCFQLTSQVQYPEKYETLRRQHLLACEARFRARQSLIEKSGDLFCKKIAIGGCWLSIGLWFVSIGFIAATAVIFFIARSFEKAHLEKVRDWDNRHPVPEEPVLRHFHDPLADLTVKDKQTLYIFDHWPGYPPFWDYLRGVVLKVDGDRCQVTGCPSRLSLHIHHILPVSKGGSHSPSNLVTLCDFHHALEPDQGHERIWRDIRTRHFTLVREHKRSNRSSAGTHTVRPHLRRLELITLNEIESLAQICGFSCPTCSSGDLEYSISKDRNLVSAICVKCAMLAAGPQQLTEETGPRLAEILEVTKLRGKWTPRWDVLSERKLEGWTEWKSDHRVAKKRKNFRETIKANNERPVCPNCGSPMRVIRPRPGNTWKAFWGCTRFKTEGCKGSMRYEA